MAGVFMRYLLFPIGLIFLLLAGPATAQQKPVTITVGDWPPYISEKQKHDGVIAHLIKDIFADEGIEVTIRFLPWGRAYQETARGQFSATGVWMHKSEREADFHYSEPVLTEKFVFFHRAVWDFQWKTLEDLREYRIGGGVKYSYGPQFDAALESGMLNIERVPNIRQNFAKLLVGRIDIFPEEINVGYASLRDHFAAEKQQQITHHKKALLNNLSYLLFPRSRPDSLILLERFNKRLKIYRAEGLYDRYLQNLREGYYL